MLVAFWGYPFNNKNQQKILKYYQNGQAKQRSPNQKYLVCTRPKFAEFELKKLEQSVRLSCQPRFTDFSNLQLSV